MKNKNISIERRKSELVKEINHLGLLNAICRFKYLCDLPDLEIKLKPLL